MPLYLISVTQAGPQYYLNHDQYIEHFNILWVILPKTIIMAYTKKKSGAKKPSLDNMSAMDKFMLNSDTPTIKAAIPGITNSKISQKKNYWRKKFKLTPAESQPGFMGDTPFPGVSKSSLPSGSGKAITVDASKRSKA